MPREFAILSLRFPDPRLILCNVALGGDAGLIDVYGSNAHMEASVFFTKEDVDGSIRTTVPLMEASALIKAVGDCRIFLKLNCEGAEVSILENLMNSGALDRVHRALIDWDIRKVPGQEHREIETAQHLADYGFDRWDYWPDAPTHFDRIDLWIREHWS